jgi:hypothetical protein
MLTYSLLLPLSCLRPIHTENQSQDGGIGIWLSPVGLDQSIVNHPFGRLDCVKPHT